MAFISLLLALPFAQASGLDVGDGPLLLRHPTLGKDTIAFQFAGDLWSVPRSGGDARRLTVGPGMEMDPHFSPDGTMLAFSGNYDGNQDVYVMPQEGGVPKRLTFHPSGDQVVGWTPDGKSVVFSSGMHANTDLPSLYTVSISGGIPRMLPFPSGSDASFSGDGTKLAFNPGFQWQAAWKRYRGGQTHRIWIGQMSDSKVKEIPRKNSNDTNPMWVGNQVYFLSDRKGYTGLFSYDTGSGTVAELVPGGNWDMKSASAGPGGIVVEHFGTIKLYDFQTKTASPVKVNMRGDFPHVRPQFKSLADYITNASISPSGNRVAFEARGRILTTPAAKGDTRDLTLKSGVAERYPAWSPDGKTIAFLSDESGEYKIVLHDAASGTETTLNPAEAPAYYYRLVWSPDSSKLAYTDNRHNLWITDVKTGQHTKVDEAPYEDVLRTTTPVWSPDSKWITFHRDLENHLYGVFLYSLDTKKLTQVTDGLSDARMPIFDASGKYLYFVASTNTALGQAWLDLSSYNHINQVSSIYAVALTKETPDPLAPESDEEGAAKENKPAGPFKIDLEGLDQRIVSLPIPPRNYFFMVPGPAGSFFVGEVGPLATVTSAPQTTLYKFDLASKALTTFARNITSVDVTPNGQKMLIGQGPMYSIVGTMAPPQPGQGMVNVSLQAKIEPRAEWRQMFREALRIQRDFLYAPNFHGVNLKELERKYEPFLANLCSREDLNYLLTDMLGELSIGHMFIEGGDLPLEKSVPGGLLGADFEIVNNRYQLKRVFNGENWNPGLRAPLTQPGVAAEAGEYIIAIDGRELTAKDDIYAALEGKAGKQVRLKLSKSPSGSAAREVTVIPTGSEFGLRMLAWREDNRRKVEQLSNGRVGYVHIPDTNIGGWTNFNRYYFAQIKKEGMVIDERFNHGGQVDDYMVDFMDRPLRSMWTSRYGKDFSSPRAANYGPKAMIVNEYAGSGGDYFPWHFRQAKLGPIIGKRTWGGLVGILAFPPLVDGGRVTAPNIAFYNPFTGDWEVENVGVSPDIEVEMDPALWRQGRDPQLERAVQEVMKQLQAQKKPQLKKPAYPDKTKVGG